MAGLHLPLSATRRAIQLFYLVEKLLLFFLHETTSQSWQFINLWELSVWYRMDFFPDNKVHQKSASQSGAHIGSYRLTMLVAWSTARFCELVMNIQFDGCWSVTRVTSSAKNLQLWHKLYMESNFDHWNGCKLRPLLMHLSYQW